MTTADYLIGRLKQLNVDTLFGVVGVPCSAFFSAAKSGKLTIVSTASDLEAGYAADGYARLKGLGVVSVSYGPGTLSLVNALAGAFAEKSPIVLVSGGPTDTLLQNQKTYDVLFSHSTGREHTDFHVLQEMTAHAVQLRTVGTAAAMIDEALRRALTTKRPVYIEVATNLWEGDCGALGAPLQPVLPPSGQETALAQQIVQGLSVASRPAVLLGEEIQRYGLSGQAQALVAHLGLPWATTVVGKSCLAENLKGFQGTYSGKNTPNPVRDIIEKSDYVLALGGVFSSGYLQLAKSSNTMARYYDGMVRFDQGARTPADLRTLLAALTAQAFAPPAMPPAPPPPVVPPPTATPGELAYDELFMELRKVLDDTLLLVADTSLSILPAADLDVVGKDSFMAGAAWASIGHSMGAGLGASFATARHPWILCGDGGFQMTATTLSTMAAHKKKCVVIVIDNALYGYEQYLLGKSYFNTPAQQPLSYAVLPRWDYVALAKALGVTNALMANSAASLATALQAAKTWTGPGLISVRVKAKTLPQHWS